MSKIMSDEEVRKCAKEFFAIAWEAKCKSIEEARAAFRELRFRVVNNIFFKDDSGIQPSLHRLIERCIKVLGTKFGNEKDIAEIAWKEAADMTSDDVTNAVKNFITIIDAKSAATFTYYAPNSVIKLGEGIRELVIGPVKARVTENVVTEINKRIGNKNFEIVVDADPVIKFQGEKTILTLVPSPIYWEVHVNASRTNVEEEALWLLSISLSLLRFSYPQNTKVLSFPYIGYKEEHPTIRSEKYSSDVIMKEDNSLDFNITRDLYIYTVDKKIIDYLNSHDFVEYTKKIFKPLDRSVGERIAQGLGWMTRGRQAQDRSERFLFFFTAIEALLSNENTNAPVTETISRHASTILFDDPVERFICVKQIKEAYDTRSNLVHRGHRNVSDSNARYAQTLTEALYRSVLENIDPNMSLSEFHGDLVNAGYGLAWPLKGKGQGLPSP